KGTADASQERVDRGLGEQEAGLAVGDGFRKPAGLVTDRQRAETLRIHLAQPARLEARRHQREVAPGADAPGPRVVEADRDGERIRRAAMGVDQRLLDLRLAGAGDDDLAAGVDDLIGRGEHEIDALLMNETRDQPEDRAARYGKPELLADIGGVGA